MTTRELTLEQQELVTDNIGLVFAVIGKIKKKFSMPDSLDYEDDLIQAGNLGLTYAALYFDVERGFQFSTYAWWVIWRAVLKCVAQNVVGDVRIPWSTVTKEDSPIHSYIDIEGLEIPEEERDIHQELDGSIIIEGIKRLNEPYRTIINEIYYKETSAAALSRQYQLSPGFVKRIEREALDFLRDVVEHMEPSFHESLP